MMRLATTTNTGAARAGRRLAAPMRSSRPALVLPHAAPALPALRRRASSARKPAPPAAALPAAAAAAAVSPLLAAAAAHAPLAMVNVDFASPSLVLGAALIGCGIILLQARNLQRRVSRDADIVVAAMVSIVGSTLIFQGWRLDPLLLLCQALTTSVAVWYGLETFRLRAQVMEEDPSRAEPGQLPPPAGDPAAYYDSSYGGRPAAPGYLPPAADRPPAPWDAAQQWGSAAGAGARPYEEQGAVVAYDYYGNPIPQAGAAAAPGAPGGPEGGAYDPAGDYASIAAGAAAAAAAAAAGTSGRAPGAGGYYEPGNPYGAPGDAGYGEAAPGYGYPAPPAGSDVYGGGYGGGYAPPAAPGQQGQQQQAPGGGPGQWRPARRDGVYDAVDDF